MPKSLRRPRYAKRKAKREADRQKKESKKGVAKMSLDILAYASVLIAAVFGLLFGAYWSSHKVSAIIFFGVAILFSDIALCAYWISKERADVSVQSGEPKSARRPPAEPSPASLPPGESHPTPVLEQPTLVENIETCTFIFGGNVAQATIKQLESRSFIPFSINGLEPQMYVDNHKFYVDVTVSDPDVLLPVEIKRGQLKVRPEGWDSNSSKAAFEVVDERGQVIFQIIYSKPSKIVVNGVFPDPQVQGQIIYVSESGIVATDTRPPNFLLKPIFKYPAWKYPGEFAD